jgi:transcriptional regulator of acetoin/glycerol metabolism
LEAVILLPLITARTATRRKMEHHSTPAVTLHCTALSITIAHTKKMLLAILSVSKEKEKQREIERRLLDLYFKLAMHC